MRIGDASCVAPGRNGASVLSNVFLAALLATGALCDTGPSLIHALDWEVVGNPISKNSTDYDSVVDGHRSSHQKCNFLERFVEAARRRRTILNFEHAVDPVMSEAQINDAPATEQYLWSRVLRSVGMSFLAGLSTTIGAGIVFLLPGSQASDTQMSFVLALAAGVMLSATIFEFWLPAFASTSFSAGLSVLFSTSAGILLFLLLSKFASEPDFAEADIEIHTGAKGDASGKPWHLVKMLLLSLTLHNFPEGFAVAVSSMGSDSLSFTIALAVAMHNIPEGIAIAVPVCAATGSRRKALGWTFASGMAEPAGAVLALFVLSATGMLTHIGIGHLLCVVGGVMFAVAFTELLPAAWSYGKPLPFVTGLLSGFVIMLVTIFLGA